MKSQINTILGSGLLVLMVLVFLLGKVVVLLMAFVLLFKTSYTNSSLMTRKKIS